MTWQQATMQGGGFIESLLQNPYQPDILYARSDVAGVFKSADRGKSWRVINNGMTDCHQHDIQSFAISPHNPDILFRCSGSVREKKFFGTIHKTVNGGESWYPVCTQADFYGNGEIRQYGDVIQVSPHNPNLVIAGAYTTGVWVSADCGEIWVSRGLEKERISCVAFHPTLTDTVFIGTVGSHDKNPKFVEQQYDFIRPNPARLYRSDDNGQTWHVLHEGLDFSELAFDPTNPDKLYGACVKDGIMRSQDGGCTWENTVPNLSKHDIDTVAIDPKNPQRVICAASTYPNYDDDVPPIGVYETLNGGESWSLIKWHTMSDLRNYPAYMTLPYAGWCIVKILIDQDDSQRLYISNWYGVAISTDGGQSWDANYFEGMENICIENMTAHPTDANTVFMVTADHNPKYSLDGGRTYAMMPRAQIDTIQPDSTAIVASRFKPNLILYSIKGPEGCSIIRATDYETTPKVVLALSAQLDTAPSELAFQSRAAGVSVQALVESPHEAGTFYAYIDGIIASGAGVYRTTDYGDSWQRLTNPFPTHITRVPHDREWIENELLSVVVAQTKNVCGTNQLLCIDPHRADTLYLGEWTEGLYRTTDGGQSWQDISAGLPFQHQHASVINVIRADPNRAGVLYAGFIREGLWRSADYGDTWQKIFPTSDNHFNATSIAVDSTGKIIIVVSEPLILSPSPSAVIISRDGGATWDDIYDPTLGAIRWKTVTIASDNRCFYAGSCGNSAFFYDLIESQ